MRIRARDHEHDVLFYVPTVAALLAGDPGCPPGGAETQVRLIAQALCRQGVRTALVAFEHPGLPSSDGEVPVLARAAHSSNPALEAVRIATALRGAPSRVVVTRQAGAHTGLVALAARAGRRRFVYSAANVTDFQFAAYESHPLKRVLFATGLRLASEIVAQTQEQQDLCRRTLHREAPVIRSAAEPGPRRQGAGNVFLWVGRVVGYKQPMAFLELADAVPQARFDMIAVSDRGGDPGLALFEELRQRAADVPNLTLLPPSNRENVLDRMSRAVAVVSTSTTEGMPNIWLEGWSRGVPALTLSHDPDQLIADRGLGLASQGNPVRFAEAAQQLWDSRFAHDELAHRCVAYVAEEHAPDAVAAKWRSVLLP